MEELTEYEFSSVILFIMLYIFYCRNRLSASEKEKYLNDLLGDENDPENIYLSDSDDDEYFPEDQCPISDTEETTEQQLEQSDYEDNQSDDEEVENEVEPLEEFMLGKDKTAWA
ncbi:hypothetical protein QTP88_000201 [Uroleucon formosanum]